MCDHGAFIEAFFPIFKQRLNYPGLFLTFVFGKCKEITFYYIVAAYIYINIFFGFVRLCDAKDQLINSVHLNL